MRFILGFGILPLLCVSAHKSNCDNPLWHRIGLDSFVLHLFQSDTQKQEEIHIKEQN